MIRGELLLKILEKLGDAVVDMADFTEAFLTSGRNTRRLITELGKKERKREAERSEQEWLKTKRRRFLQYVSRLKQDGLITVMNKQNPKIKITSKGKNKKIALGKNLSLKTYYRNYRKEKNVNFTIVAFDIPERLRRYRAWLRDILKLLDFSMIQKSVWFGQTKIPEQFINDLENFEILEYVEIFEINKQGSLKKFL